MTPSPHQTCSKVAKPVGTRRPAAQGHAFPCGATQNRSTGPPCSVVQAVAVPRCTGVTEEGDYGSPGSTRQATAGMGLEEHSCSNHEGSPFLLCAEVLDAGKTSLLAPRGHLLQCLGQKVTHKLTFSLFDLMSLPGRRGTLCLDSGLRQHYPSLPWREY